MLTSRIRARKDIPGEPGQWMELRALSGSKLEDAERVKTREGAHMFVEMAVEMAAKGLDPKEIAASFDTEQAKAEKADDPLATYDIETIVRAGIVQWSYQERLTPQNVADLDPDTRRWAALQILALTEESEEARKRASQGAA